MSTKMAANCSFWCHMQTNNSYIWKKTFRSTIFSDNFIALSWQMNITQWPKVLGLHVTLYIWVGVKSNWRHSHRNELQSSVNAAEQNVCITSIKNLTLFCLDKKSSLNLKTSIKVWNFLDITIKTSPPPRMSGIASAWTSVGKLFLRTINDFVFKIVTSKDH